MSEMVERVAQILIERRYPGAMAMSTAENGYTILPPDIWMAALEDARAVIEAMREPTRAMRDATDSIGDTARARFEREWRTAIDEALK